MAQRQLVITIEDNGNLGVQGIADPVSTFGMLEMAKFAIIDHFKEQQRQVQLAAPGTVLPPLVNR